MGQELKAVTADLVRTDLLLPVLLLQSKRRPLECRLPKTWI